MVLKGCLIYGWVSDNYGRYPVFLVSNMVVACSGIILPYCQDFHTFATMRFIMGLNFTTFFTSINVLGKGTIQGFQQLNRTMVNLTTTILIVVGMVWPNKPRFSWL